MSKLILRKANSNDMDLLFKWANDPDVRKNSFSTNDIVFDEHKKWFLELLNDKSRQQYICEREGVPIGQVRISFACGNATISYSVDHEFRHRGYGIEMLKLIKKAVVEDFPDAKVLIGEVKPDNLASQKAFLNAGYIEKSKVFVCDITDF